MRARRGWCSLPRQRVSASRSYRAGASPRGVHRVPQGAFERLERHAWKRARAVLRGGGGGNTISLPDLLVEWAAHGFRTTMQDMGRDHGGLHVLMPEQCLHGAHSVPGFQHMRGTRVAAGVTGDGCVDPGQACGGAHGFLQTACIQVMATLGTRAGVHRAACGWKHVLPAPRTVGVGICALQCIREIHRAVALHEICGVHLLRPRQVRLSRGHHVLWQHGDPIFSPLPSRTRSICYAQSTSLTRKRPHSSARTPLP